MPRKLLRVSSSLQAAVFVCLLIPTWGDAAAAGTGSKVSRETHAYQVAWKDALEQYRKGNFTQTIRIFEKMPEGDSLAALYRKAVLASVRLRSGDTAEADRGLAEVLATPRIAADSIWAGHFHRLRLRTMITLPPSARRDYLRIVVRAPVPAADRAQALYRLLDLDTGVVGRAERLDYLRGLVSLAPATARLDSAYRRSLPLFDADTSRAAQRLLLDLEEKLALWGEAIARADRLASRNLDSTAVRPLLIKIALWHYNRGAYEESLKRYQAWIARYGEAPEALLQTARAHRSLGREAAARDAYSNLLTRFPKDSRSAEVLWMRAFDDEMSGRVDTALGAYHRIAREFPQHVRSGEALLRAGLIRLRRGDAAGAAAAFAELRLARKSGRLTGAARYWEGKARAAVGDSANAAASIAGWTMLVREHPFGHYGHLARAELVRRAALPDSLRWERTLNRADGDALRAWLDAAIPGTPVLADSVGESRLLPVNILFDLGLDTLAVLTLQARASAAPGALRPLYEAAVQCRVAGFDYEAYRFGLRVSDRLPLAQWPDAPVAVLRLFYPPSYDAFVRPAADQAAVPHRLVSALIKQESGFDPVAVSRVGARGLMQLMPATGAEQARKEKMAGFHTDSLFVPAVNVRLGVAYLRDVLKRHDGDVALALAHYNAGPTAVARWMPRLEGRPLEDVAEDIGYAETREYIKRVGANWKTYEVLWGSEKP